MAIDPGNDPRIWVEAVNLLAKGEAVRWVGGLTALWIIASAWAKRGVRKAAKDE